MYIGYIQRLKLCIKWTYANPEMASLPANDATQVDELQRFALPDSRPLPIMHFYLAAILTPLPPHNQ